MADLCWTLSITLLIFQRALADSATDSTCGNNLVSSRKLNLVINSRKEDDGEWLTTFHALKTGSKSSNITVDLTHAVQECGNEQTVHIQGLIRASKSNVTEEKLRFHPRCGKNAAISNDGRTVQKINLEDPLNGVVLTDRPLRRNDLFEVRLDKKHNKFSYSFGIGITTYSPYTYDIPDHMYNLKSGNWMYYLGSVYINGAETVKAYGPGLNDLNVGDRVGVMVNNLGALHFFVNGADVGPAASNIPETVYGVFELYYNAAKGTIVSPP